MKKILFLILIALCACEQLSLEDVTSEPLKDPVTSLTNFEKITGRFPDPSTTGEYGTCRQNYTLGMEYGYKNVVKEGTLVYPCRANDKKTFPLVVILHADGMIEQNGVHTYINLMERIASHGFIVQFYSRNSVHGNTDEGKKLFTDHLKFSYTDNNSNTKGYIDGNIALIGHSAGGSTLRVVDEIPAMYGYNLKAIISMSPTVYSGEENMLNDFSKYSPAFLGFCNFSDDDDNAYGVKENQKIMETAFKDYDEFGLENPNGMWTKDMIYFNHGKGALGMLKTKHYYQDTEFLKFYVTAFLLQHIKGWEYPMNQYFKYQNKPVTVGEGILGVKQMHYDHTYHRIATFNPEDVYSYSKSEDGTIEIEQELSYINDFVTNLPNDPYTPHRTNYLKIKWENANENTSVTLPLSNNNSPMDISSYSHLSFRVSQMYEGIPIDSINFKIVMTDDEFKQSVRIDIKNCGGITKITNNQVIYGGKLKVWENPMQGLVQGIPVDATKNAMRSYVIPINIFEGVDKKNVMSISLEFSDPQHASGTIVFDDLALID